MVVKLLGGNRGSEPTHKAIACYKSLIVLTKLRFFDTSNKQT